MSNPTVTTKLMTLVKGIFGRKEPASAIGSAQVDKTTKSETAAQEVAETPEAAVTVEAPDTKDEAVEVAVDASEAATSEEAPTKTTAEDTAAEEPKAETTAEDAPTEETSAEEPRTDPAVPATADVEEEGEAIAEEIAVAEAHTEVASDEVLEKVRKEVAPAADELAVPTYDELTLPSIRARLRKLTADQVRDLRAYEVAHQGRSEFIRMYDNRIAKLESPE